MRRTTETHSLAVYRIAATGKLEAVNAMCDQADWPEVERLAKGRNTLVRGNIVSESEAERLARGTSGDRKPKKEPARHSPVVAQ
jgi:hypothetical protein